MKRQEWPEVTVCTEESEGSPGDRRCPDYISHDATRRGRRQPLTPPWDYISHEASRARRDGSRRGAPRAARWEW